MDLAISQLESGSELNNDIVQDIRLELKLESERNGKLIVKKSQNLNSYATKAWKILAIMAKAPKLSCGSIQLSEICAQIIDAAESSLKLKRLDFDKLLINVYGKSIRFANSEKLSDVIQKRLSRLLAPKSPTTNTSISLAEVPLAEIQDVDAVNVAIMYLITHISSLNCKTTIRPQLKKFMERQYQLSPSGFSKYMTILAQRDYETAIYIACASDICVKECLKALSGVPTTAQYPIETLTVRVLVVFCHLGLDIPQSTILGNMDNGDLWAIASGKIPNNIKSAGPDHFFILSALRRFQKVRERITGQEMTALLDLIGPKCSRGDECKLLRWCVKSVHIETLEASVLARIKDISVGHLVCVHHSLFATGVQALKKNLFDMAIYFLKLSVCSQVQEDAAELEAQKYDHLAMAYQATGALYDALLAQSKAIDLTCTKEVLVLSDVPNSDLNMRIVKRAERWLRYLSLVKDERIMCDAICPESFTCSFYANILAPLLPSITLPLALRSKLTSRFVNGERELVDLLKESFVNYDQLTVEHIKQLEGVSFATSFDEMIIRTNNIWLNALRHFVSIADPECILNSKYDDVDTETAGIRSLLLAIYDVEYFLSMPICPISSTFNPSKLDHLVFMSWKFLCRSIVFSRREAFIQAIEFALESQRFFDLILRCLASNKVIPGPEDKLRIDAIAAHLFVHLSLLYGQRPFLKEARYYFKQATSSSIVSRNDSFRALMSNVIETGCPVGRCSIPLKVSDNDSVCGANNKDSVRCYMTRSPLVSGLVSVDRADDELLLDKFKFLFDRLAAKVNRGSRLNGDELDQFGIISLKLNRLEDFCKFLEYNMSVVSLNFQFNANYDADREPTASINITDLSLSRDRSIMISRIRDTLLSMDILWVVLYGSNVRIFRLPVPEGKFNSWCGELESIENLNKKLLKKKEGMTTEEKRQWWEQRIGLDKRMSSLVVSIRQLLGSCIDWKYGDNVSNISIGNVELNMNGLCSRYTDDLVDLIHSSLQFHGLSVDRNGVISALQEQHIEHELDNVFMADQSNSHEATNCHLLLTSDLYQFPWEVILDEPFVRCIPIIRAVPSDPPNFVGEHQNFVSYVINPSGDLVETERRLAPVVTASTDFCGVLGRPPSEQEVTDFLTSSRLYLYCGHGGGDAYISHSKISKLTKIAPSLLIGCSSGRIKCLGMADPEGNPIAYSKASSPFVVCNLWDVTDKDIDAFTIKLLGDLLEMDSYDVGTVARRVQNARNECNLKFINGAAPVLYQPFIVNKLD